ncbi:TraX family protein [Oribacterium sp. WCC10]|uniref:TraX family protein n=1 Tax=Oribacterium sp. WCC10 TaxID=1855343 RepID=UPI0008F012AA|nr:TraX family protein [Oribacterium sp. WCC10]SFG12901.1 TraX protein [Oribacterium sp. WCC10]
MATYHSVLNSTKKNIGISGGTLKFFAALMMTAYYFAVIIIQNGKLYGYVDEYYQMAIATEEGARWLKLFNFLIVFRHFSFPFFAFLLVEGFIHTSGFWKYFIRVLVFAIISEVPFDLCLYNETYNWGLQNPLFTLAAGLLVMHYMYKWRHNVFMKWGVVALGAGIAYLLNFQFGLFGILSIAFMYNFHKEKVLQIGSGAIVTAIGSVSAYFLPVLCFIPIWFYNGERGHFNPKWLYYIYYPLHLVVFYMMIYIGAMITV